MGKLIFFLLGKVAKETPTKRGKVGRRIKNRTIVTIQEQQQKKNTNKQINNNKRITKQCLHTQNKKDRESRN